MVVLRISDRLFKGLLKSAALNFFVASVREAFGHARSVLVVATLQQVTAGPLTMVSKDNMACYQVRVLNFEVEAHKLSTFISIQRD
jgi:hypothetical protein